MLFIEVRNHENRQVSFACVDLNDFKLKWNDFKLEEPWWINLTAAIQNLLIFTIYLETNNPDKKGVLVYDAQTLQLIWWNNDFSITTIDSDKILGYERKLGVKERVLDLYSGNTLTDIPRFNKIVLNEKVNRPMKYEEGSANFDMVKTFLQRRLNLSVVSALEYLEYDEMIFISYYEKGDQLDNYLIVLSGEGELMFKEKIGERLEGIGYGTFFILSGSVFFVKNKVELVSYKIL